MSQTSSFPKAGIGAVVFRDQQVLLIKRANPPCQNEWAIPGGKIKPGETLQQAAEREILEETGITIRAKQAIFAFDLIENDSNGNVLYHYVIVDLAADYLNGIATPRSDASDVAWFSKTALDTVNLNQTTRELLARFKRFEH